MDTLTLERRLRQLEDLEALRNLKHRYFAACDRKDPKAMRACFADGAVTIDYGAIGTFASADALVQVFTTMACHPHMVELHHGANAQLEIVDLQRARGTWSLLYQLINTETRAITQLAGSYEDEYLRSETGWKIVKTRFVATSTLALEYQEGMLKAGFAGRP